MRQVDIKKVRELRQKNGKSLEYMAEVLGYSSPNGYYYLEIGRGKFSAEALAKVADEFNVPIDSLFFTQKDTESVTNSA